LKDFSLIWKSFYLVPTRLNLHKVTPIAVFVDAVLEVDSDFEAGHEVGVI
jgi:hypothetical protein